MAQAQSEMEAAVNLRQAAQAELTKVMNVRTRKSEAIQLLAAVMESTTTATVTIAKDPQVLATQQQLAGSQEKLKAELSALDQQVRQATEDVASKTEKANVAIEKKEAMANQLADADRVSTANDFTKYCNANGDRSPRQYEDSTEKLSRQLVNHFVVSDLRALSPEQLANAMMESLGVTAVYRRGVIAELDKAKPLTDADKNDSATMIRREREISEGVEAKIAAIRNEFVTLYGAGAGQVQTDFFSTIDQALYITNGSRVTGWVASNSYLVGGLLKLEDSAQIAEDLYISVLSRKPSGVEIQRVQEFLESVGDQKSQVTGHDMGTTGIS